MSSSYRRVNTSDETNNNAEGRPKDRATIRAERIGDKIYAFAWVVIASLTAYWAGFPRVILSDPRVVHQPVYYVSVALFGTMVVMFCYLSFYLPYIKKIPSVAAWDVYCPRAVPIMTLCGILFIFTLIRSTWPVWGFLSPLILAIEAMGALFALHFVPWFGSGQSAHLSTQS